MYIVWNTACSTTECSRACSINYTKKDVGDVIIYCNRYGWCNYIL